MNQLLILFIVCNIANVIIQTIKSLATVKGGAFVASLANAIAYAFYTYIIIITNCELPLWQKMTIVGLANLIGVFVVKFIEGKMRKDKLWKIETTLPKEKMESVLSFLRENDVPFNYIENIGKYVIVNCYCKTQKESAKVRELIKIYGGKYFASESKIL